MLRCAPLRYRRERRERLFAMRANRLCIRWEIPGQPPCVRHQRQSDDGPCRHDCARARGHPRCCHPKAARRLRPTTMWDRSAHRPWRRRPMPNIAPRWVLIPEVAASIAASASRPMILRRPIPQPLAPASAKAWKYGAMAEALIRNVSASISSWLPGSTWLTRPGFGHVSNSSRRQWTALAAMAPTSRMRGACASEGCTRCAPSARAGVMMASFREERGLCRPRRRRRRS